ncbi:TfuA-like protein (plasmid) [Streptomyces sp. NBC_00335]|uniref:TfuA-like protein n=1 Tax=unclassified Streptomyces TaxID=2593676 RepID=UPI00225244E4|nr:MULTISPECIES: TfuA-like protein [unclassified Streptomyces]MCX5410056.1 TfuA-like protein [Streptomyces sp. NBC_00086]
MTTHVFVGAALGAEEVRTAFPGAALHPPARHGDLLALAAGPGDTVVLLDGVQCHGTPVSHEEILDLLADGARVVGAAGFGALRAAELWPYGMRGIGLVFGMFVQGSLDGDAEVAAHRPTHTHEHPTLALVTLRWTVASAVSDRLLTPGTGEILLGLAGSLHCAERCWPALLRLARAHSVEAGEAAASLRAYARRTRSTTDLQRVDSLLALSWLAQEAPASAAAPSAPDPLLVPAWFLAPTSRRAQWRGTFRPARGAPRHPAVRELDVLRFQQLYAPDFPARYRGFALRRIAGNLLPAGEAELEACALESAARAGITADLLPAQAWEHWLTPAERRAGTPWLRLLTLLVRSFRSAPGDAPFHGVPAELRQADAVWAASTSAVAAIDRLGESAATTGAGGTARRVPVGEVRGHLREIWGAGSPASLQAAARDRGFASLAEAEEAARRFLPLRAARAVPAQVEAR